MLTAGEENARAVKLRDQGDVKGAEELLQRNAAQLELDARRYKDKRLLERRDQVKKQADQVRKKPEEWNYQRKFMKKTISDDPLEGLKF